MFAIVTAIKTVTTTALQTNYTTHVVYWFVGCFKLGGYCTIGIDSLLRRERPYAGIDKHLKINVNNTVMHFTNEIYVENVKKIHCVS